MIKNSEILVLVMLLVLIIFSICFAEEITWQNISRENSGLCSVLINPYNAQIIFVGTDNAVLKSEDGGKSWIRVLSVSGLNRKVNSLSFSPIDNNSLYAATGNGLFHSANSGKNWQRIFKGKALWENSCTCAAVLTDTLYLGTEAGLFISKNKGRSWVRENGLLGNIHILSIAYNIKEPECIYVASKVGVFRTQDSGKTWDRVFVSFGEEKDNEEAEEIGEESDKEEGACDLRHISLDQNDSNCIYLASARGIYKSLDRGKSWVLLTGYGLLSRDTAFLWVSNKSKVFIANKSGIFEYRNNRWHELSFNLFSGKINAITMDNMDNLYAASERGLFKRDASSLKEEEEPDLALLYCKDEPAIEDVQKAAIKYAEVEPDKIKKWRKMAAKRAYLPKVSVGINRDTGDLFHWESGSTTKVADDVLMKGKDTINWDVSLSWDLGDIVWSSEQTSIDVRSRLNVQLRDDILDEVNKIYFERLRTKMELANLNLEEKKKRFDKELKLRELTASLDAFTGGYFSSRLTQN